MKVFYYPVIVLCFLSSSLFAQNISKSDSVRTDSLSLDDLLKLKSSGISSELEKQINEKVGVASKKPLSYRQSPSIITVLTDDDIQKSGARDITDVLNMVPSFQFGADVQGNIGLGIRGNWANEGKVLVLLDGQEMNETLFGNVAFGNNYPISQIKRVEIIRGPGSAIYGGFAEYGVVNIVTKSGEELNGFQANALYGQMSGLMGRANLSLSIGKKIKDWDISLAGMIGQGNRSNQDYTDIHGNTYNMAGSSNSNPTYANLGIGYKDLKVRFIYDNLNTTNRDNYSLITSKAYPNNFQSVFAEVKYDFKIGNKLVITPKFNYKQQKPWNFSGVPEQVDSVYSTYNKTANRYRGNITASWDIFSNVNLIAGGEMFIDNAAAYGDSAYWFSTTNGTYKNSVEYYNYAGFAQVLWKNRIVNVTSGFRYDENSSYGNAFVPRLGLTKKIGAFNFKLLYANSFRAPTIENVSLAAGRIKPEKTAVIEFETGVQLGRNGYLTLNLFDITTQNPIIFYSDTSSSLGTAVTLGNYLNKDQIGSQGIELEYKHKSKWGFLNANYSYYTAANKPSIDNYTVPNNHALQLGFGAHKLYFLWSYNITNHLSINPSFTYLSNRYGYTTVESLRNAQPTDLGSSYLFNINVQYDNFLTKGLSVALACYDVFGQNLKYITPYNNGHAPLPGPSREFTLRLTYNLALKK